MWRTRSNCISRSGLWCGLLIDSSTIPSGTHVECRSNAAATAIVVLGTASGARRTPAIFILEFSRRSIGGVQLLQRYS